MNQREAPAASNITLNFPTAGAYPYELDYAKGGYNNLTLTMLANGAPVPAAVLLTLTPAIVPSNTAGQIQQFVLTAADADGVALKPEDAFRPSLKNPGHIVSPRRSIEIGSV